MIDKGTRQLRHHEYLGIQRVGRDQSNPRFYASGLLRYPDYLGDEGVLHERRLDRLVRAARAHCRVAIRRVVQCARLAADMGVETYAYRFRNENDQVTWSPNDVEIRRALRAYGVQPVLLDYATREVIVKVFGDAA